MRDAIWHWPNVPALPPPGRFVLICVRTSGRRAEARKEVRAVLRRVLAKWTDLRLDEVPLQETPSGPVWQSDLRHPLPLRGGEGKGEGAVSIASSFMESLQVDRNLRWDHEPSRLRNIQHPTSNIELPTEATRAVIGCWALDVGCWMFPRFMDREFVLSCRTRSPGAKHFSARPTAPPLPKGEGWGEGEGDGLLKPESLDFSLSYTEDEAWIAVRRGGVIGIDVMRLQPVPEAEAIAQTYFGPADRSALRQSTHPVRDFVLAWTQLEARCKCLKQGLTEWSEALAPDTKACTTESLIIQDKLALSVATVP